MPEMVMLQPVQTLTCDAVNCLKVSFSIVLHRLYFLLYRFLLCYTVSTSYCIVVV